MGRKEIQRVDGKEENRYRGKEEGKEREGGERGRGGGGMRAAATPCTLAGGNHNTLLAARGLVWVMGEHQAEGTRRDP